MNSLGCKLPASAQHCPTSCSGALWSWGFASIHEIGHILRCLSWTAAWQGWSVKSLQSSQSLAELLLSKAGELADVAPDWAVKATHGGLLQISTQSQQLRHQSMQ